MQRTYINRFLQGVTFEVFSELFVDGLEHWSVWKKCTHTHTHTKQYTFVAWDSIHQNMYLPRKGDFIAASTIPTSSCRLLGSWASPEAKAARASAWRPRYWRATPCRKYACRGKEERHAVYEYTLVATCIFIFSYVNMASLSSFSINDHQAFVLFNWVRFYINARLLS